MVRSILVFGVLAAALSLCGLTEKLKSLTGGTNTSTSNTSTAKNPGSNSATSSISSEKAALTPDQQAIVDAGTETKWDDQGLSWKLPAGWKKMDVQKQSFNYQSPDLAFLLVNITPDLGDSFPMETSLKAYYDQAMLQLKNGKYESVKLVEIDGIPGVEFTEAPPSGKDDPRRHQWIAYRRYLGQTQQINVMCSTKGSNFDKHKDDFQAILYSINAVK